jgi:tight adherence protein B
MTVGALRVGGYAVRTAALVGATVLGLLLTAGPALAAGDVNIDHVQSVDGEGTLLLSVDGLPDGATADSNSVRVEIDGRATDSWATGAAKGADRVQRSSVLVLDTSLSMRRDGRFDAAIAAVDTYLATTPSDVGIGLVTFAADVHDPIAPGADRAAIQQALESVELQKDTAVHDAIVAGVDALGSEGARSLLVLSDGGDTSSATTLDVAISKAVDAGVVVDVVSLDDGGRLTPIADATGGRVFPADPEELESVFADQAAALAEQLVVKFDVPTDVSAESDVSVAVTAAGVTYHDTALVALSSSAAPTARENIVDTGRSLVDTPLMLGGAAAVFLGLAGILWIVVAGPKRSAAEQRLDQYFASKDGRSPGRRAEGRAEMPGLRDTAVQVAGKVVHRDLETKISQRLTGAGSSLMASEWIVLHAGIAVGAAVLGWLLNGFAMAVLLLVLGAVGPWFYLSFRHSRRLAAFNGQLAETLGLIAGGLQAGLSLPQAIDSVVQEGNEPMAGELKRALIEQRLGIDITDALEGVGERMESADFGWVVMAIRIQREVGGNLAEILHTVADTLREREYLRRQVRALSAEGRLSGYILTALPILVGIYMAFGNPEYASVLWTTFTGLLLLGAAVVLLCIGSFFMAKLAKVEV